MNKNKFIIDCMKKEGSSYKSLSISCYVWFIFTLLLFYLNRNTEYAGKVYIPMASAFFMIGSYCLYGWLYAIKYKVEISKEKVILKTLFRKLEINMNDIINYTCKQHNRKSVFYGFRLYTKEEKFLVYTRYIDEFTEILKEIKIKDKT